MTRAGPRRTLSWLAGLLAVAVAVLSPTRSAAEPETDAISVFAVDENGERVDLATSHASITRTLPAFLGDVNTVRADSDALRWIVAGPRVALPHTARFSTRSADGRELDATRDIELEALTCPPWLPPGAACVRSPAIRLTVDHVDRDHPESQARSLEAEVGGTLGVVAAQTRASIVVGGPRHTALGAIDRLRARLRVRVLRVAAGASPAIGVDDVSAVALARREVQIASRIWGQCGIHFGLAKDLDVRVVDPPPAFLIAVGCDAGLPGSGGVLRAVVEGKPIRVPIAAGDLPGAVAERLARAIRTLGFDARLSPNLQILSGANPTVDVLVRTPGGRLATVTSDGREKLSTDPSLNVCLGQVDLTDGLQHFGDSDAAAGTVEERTLIKALDDGDPKTIEVLVIARLDRSGGIGESFINGDGASVRDTVIIDRLAVRAGARSFALAHELGHVLLNMPGHPDDYGVDQPTLLMDADAADPTIFGPRRLTIEDCERALRESGPNAFVPLLSAWPLPVQPPPQARPKAARGVTSER